MNAPLAPATPPRRRRWLPWLILAVAVGIAAVLISTRPESAPVEVNERAWLVDFQVVAPGRYSPVATLYGRLESLWNSELTAGVAADVLEVPVVEGQVVSEGDLLVRLDDRDAKLVLAQREAELRQAEARVQTELRRHQANLEALPRERRLLALTRDEVGRLQDLVTQRVGAQSALDEAQQAAERQAIALSTRQQAVDEHAARLADVQAHLARAEALRDQARLDVERCTVTAPFTGRVVSVPASPGQRVRVGDPLVSIFDTGAMVVRAQLPARILPAVRESMARGETLRARGLIDGIPVEAYLRNLAAEAADGTGGVDGLFAVENDTRMLGQGRFLRLDLHLGPLDDLLALPREAIYGADRIYLVDEDSRMRGMRIARVGEWRTPDGDSRVLVRAGDLPVGARIVTTQLPNALDGLLLQVARDG
jgi:multidrug efflux pump subunit AcrA (membrane-fusion protein)